MNKYFIKYTVPVNYMSLGEEIRYNPNNKMILNVKIEQIVFNSINIYFFFYDKINFKYGYDITTQILPNILNIIAFYYSGVSVGNAVYQESNLEKDKEQATLKCSLNIGRPDLDEDLKKALQSNANCNHRLYEMFRLAKQSTDAVNKYMFLYQILLYLYNNKQKYVDKFIRENSQKLRIDPEYRLWQTERNGKRNYDSETIFTFLRNQVGHVIEGCTPETTSSEMSDKLKDLECLVKHAMVQNIKSF